MSHYNNLRWWEVCREHIPVITAPWTKLSTLGSRAGALVRALAFHQFGPGSIPGIYTIYNTIQYILNWPLPIGAFQGQWNTMTEQNNNNCSESQLAGGKPVGYLQVRLGSWTRDYQDQIQRVVRASPEPGISGSQGPNHWATLPP